MIKPLVAAGRVVQYDDAYTLPERTVLGNLSRWRTHLRFQAAVEAAGLAPMLERESVTVLAPTDAALQARYPNGTIDIDAVKGCIIPGRVFEELPLDRSVELSTLAGTTLSAIRTAQGVTITTAQKQSIPVSVAAIPCANGNLSVINQLPGE